VMRLTHACLPLLRAAPQAQIVNLSSLFGIIAPAGQAAYAASKFAVRGFTEALRHECEGSGLGVTLVHPGGVATAIARNARRPRAMDPCEAAAGLAAFERLLTLRPETAAAAILRGIETRAPRVVIGSDARRAVLIQRLMPVRYWSLIARAME
jgi:short-subunit dehydrogenase